MGEQKDLIISVIGGLILSALFFWVIDSIAPIEVVYDCRLAEISVDYPVQVKEKCRRLSHG